MSVESSSFVPALASTRSVPYPTADQKRRKLRVAIVTGEWRATVLFFCNVPRLLVYGRTGFAGRDNHTDTTVFATSIPENFLPKVDGVTRTLARLLEHLNAEGHEAIVFGPETGIVSKSADAVCITMNNGTDMTTVSALYSASMPATLSLALSGCR